MSVGYIGLGDMGGALARRLHLSHPLVAYDLNLANLDQLVACGARAATGLPDMAASCEVIFLCLPTSQHVRSVIFGADGLATALRPGTVIIDQTTGDPIETRKMASELAAREVALVDAPVSGGAKGATAGTISIMVGASEELLDRARPFLDAISRNVFHAGDIGAGHVMKLVNNMISGTQRLLSLEGLALAAKNGIDPAKAVEILSVGGARNAFLAESAPRLLTGNFGTGLTLELMHKDLRLACQLGADSGMALLYGSLTREFYQLCIGQVGAGERVDRSAVAMERLAGTTIVPEEKQ